MKRIITKPKHKTARDMLIYAQARIEGLAGTVRYDLSEDLCRELGDLGRYLNTVTKIHPVKPFEMFVKNMPEEVLEEIEKEVSLVGRHVERP